MHALLFKFICMTPVSIFRFEIVLQHNQLAKSWWCLSILINAYVVCSLNLSFLLLLVPSVLTGELFTSEKIRALSSNFF